MPQLDSSSVLEVVHLLATLHESRGAVRRDAFRYTTILEYAPTYRLRNKAHHLSTRAHGKARQLRNKCSSLTSKATALLGMYENLPAC
jgi:hypothetical protein